MAGESNGSAGRTSGLKRTVAGGIQPSYWGVVNSQMSGGPPKGNPISDNYAPAPFSDGEGNRGRAPDNYGSPGYSAPTKAAYRSKTGG